MELSSEKEHLVLDNRKLVHYLVQNLGVTQNSSEYEDIVSIGTIGLIKAAITFNSSKKIKFATYASRCINNEIFMHYRKANKYANDISLDEPILDDGKGTELTLVDTIEDPDSDFVEKILNNECFIQLVSIILNCLEERTKLAVLYQMGEISQADIAKKLNISRSYVSRIITKGINKIREIANNQIQYKEVFSMAIVGDEYRISFSSKDISKFNQIFATLLQNLNSTENLPDFRVNCNRERIVIQIPAHPESFSFIAQIIQEIDDFNMTFISDKSISPNDTTVMQESKSDDTAERDNTVEESKSCAIAQNPDVIPDDADKTEIVKRGSQVKQVRDYMLSLNSFTVKDLKHHFPNMKSVSIKNAVYLAKGKGLITATGRGKYIVNKT